MGKAMKILAIAVLLITIAGAGVVLYAVNTLSPVVVSSGVVATPAAQAQEIFDATAKQLAQETFTGRVFSETAGLDAGECTFLTYTLRLQNKGLFPAEWVSLDIHPLRGDTAQDVYQMDNYSANVLGSRTQGDIAATVLCRGDAQNTRRSYTVSCYVLGQKLSFDGVIE